MTSERLAARVHRGDQAAFQELYERVAPALFAWASLRLPGGAFAGLEPQDVLQEVWMRALAGLDGYDPQRSFRGWVIGIAKHVVLQAHDRRRPLLPLAGPDGSGSFGARDVPDTVTSASARLAKHEALSGFLSFVEALPEEDRQLVVLCGLEGRTANDAAVQLGISSEAATKRWQALRARLREVGALKTLALDALGV